VPQVSRVLLVVAHGGNGGMQVQVGLLAGALRAAGCDVAVAAGPGPIDADVDVVRLPSLSARTAGAFASALRRAAAEVSPDVVHGHGLRLAPFLAVSGRRRAVVTCHGVDPAQARRSATVARLTGVAVASCGQGPRRTLGTVGLKSRVLDNAVPPMPAPIARPDVLGRFDLPTEDLLVVSPARLTEQKDPVTLVRALAHARVATAVLVGGGPLAPEVERAVAREGLDGRVRVVGWLDDARELIASADVCALASRWEGQPTVVLEAMAAGVAVAATACTGTVDTVVDAETGLLAPVGDAVTLGASLARLADPGLRERLASAGRLTAQAHAPAVVAAAHLDAYERLLAGRWLDPPLP
jgi:glycosyltransferase involved in cell wall biosynthesis